MGWGWVIVATDLILIPRGGMAIGVIMHYLRTKERMLAMEKGLALPPEPLHRPKDPWQKAGGFRVGGLINVAVGIGLLIMFVSLSKSLDDFPKGVIAVSAIPFLI